MNIPDTIMRKFKENINNEKTEMTLVGKQMSRRAFGVVKIIIAVSTVLFVGVLFLMIIRTGTSIEDSFDLLLKGEIFSETVFLLFVPLVIIFDVIIISILRAVSKRPEYFTITDLGIHKIKNGTYRFYAWTEFTGDIKEHVNALGGSLIYNLNTFKVNSKGKKNPETLPINDIHSYRRVKQVVNKYVN